MLPLSGPHYFRIPITICLALMLATQSISSIAQDDDEKSAPNPLRLSYVEGEVSFWRDGADDWVEARPNIPLAAGDALYVGSDSDLELQMGSRAFVRADDETHLALVNQTADFTQFKITSGRVSFDLRSMPSGNSIEVDTPNAVFTIDHAGYYRVEVDGTVHFITRRGGRALMVPAGGPALSIHPSEEIVVRGMDVAQAETYVAPELDRWDRWNYDRTEDMLDAVSERYLPAGVAGAYDLDRYGYWRVVPDYGPVWVPATVPTGWAPYSTGSWVWDPYYQWTWVDDAPWGWTPFHYGRWVYLGGYWAWAPGPVVRAAVYAPAMVAFFGVSPQVSVGIRIGSAGVGWVALSWGEPLIPWWGRPHFIGRPWWGGWGGPRVVNNVVVRNTSIINVKKITYTNTRVNNGIVAIKREFFGKGHIYDAPIRGTRPGDLKHFQGALPVQPDSASVVAGARKGLRPPAEMVSRPVVTARPARDTKLPWRAKSPKREDKPSDKQRYVTLPKRPAGDLPRPAFGDQGEAERSRPSSPPRFMERKRDSGPSDTEPVMKQQPEPIRAEPESIRSSPQRGILERKNESVMPEQREKEGRRYSPRAVPEDSQRQNELARPDLPGKPANRIYRGNGNENKNKNRRRSNE